MLSKYLFSKILEFLKNDWYTLMPLGLVNWQFHSIVKCMSIVPITDVDDFIRNKLNNKYSLVDELKHWSPGFNKKELCNPENIKQFTDLLPSMIKFTGDMPTLSKVVALGARPKSVGIEKDEEDGIGNYIFVLEELVDVIEELQFSISFEDHNDYSWGRYLVEDIVQKCASYTKLKIFGLHDTSSMGFISFGILEDPSSVFNNLSLCTKVEELYFSFLCGDNFFIDQDPEAFFTEFTTFVKNHPTQIKNFNIENYISTSIVDLYLTSDKFLKLPTKYISSKLLIPIERKFEKISIKFDNNEEIIQDIDHHNSYPNDSIQSSYIDQDLGPLVFKSNRNSIFTFDDKDFNKCKELYLSFNNVEYIKLKIEFQRYGYELERLIYHLKGIIKFNHSSKKLKILYFGDKQMSTTLQNEIILFKDTLKSNLILIFKSFTPTFNDGW